MAIHLIRARSLFLRYFGWGQNWNEVSRGVSMPRSWVSLTRNAVPVVSVRMGERHYEAMSDTSAFISMISPELSIRLGLPIEGQQPVISVHGDVRNRNLVVLP